MKKGRHRRFEEARKLKQSGPGAFDLGFGDRGSRGPEVRPPPSTKRTTTTPPWQKYGVEFDDEDAGRPTTGSPLSGAGVLSGRGCRPQGERR